MASPPQLVQFAFAGGVDEGQQPEVLDPTTGFLVLENVRQDRRGAVSKRRGFRALPVERVSELPRGTAGSVFAHMDQICVVDAAGFLDAYSQELDAWSTRSLLPKCSAFTRRLVAMPIGGSTPGAVMESTSTAYANGFYLVAYAEVDSTGSYFIVGYVVEAATGNAVFAQRMANGLSSTQIMIRVITAGTDGIVVWRDGHSSGTISAARIDLSSALGIGTGFVVSASLATNAGTSPGDSWDVCALATSFVMTYVNNGGGTTRVTTRLYDSATLAQTATVSSTTLNAQNVCVAVHGEAGGIVWVGWTHSTSANVYVEGRNPSTLAVTATSAAVYVAAANGPGHLAIARTGPVDGIIAWASDSVAGLGHKEGGVGRFSGGGGTVGPNGSVLAFASWIPSSKPFFQGGRVYMQATHATGATCLFDVTDTNLQRVLQPMAWTKPRLQANAGVFRAENPARGCTRVSATVVAVYQGIRASSVGEYGTAAEYTFEPAKLSPTLIGAATALRTGVPYVYDGIGAHEIGFLAPPVVAASAGGATGISGTYLYTAIYEFVDSSGNVHWSETAPIVVVTTAGTQTITVVVSACHATWKDGSSAPEEPFQARRIRVKVFRTTNGGSVFYLHTTIVNLPGVTTYTISDTTIDSLIQSNAQLYRQPGIPGTALSRQCPPGFVDQCEYQGLLVGIDGESVWHSGSRVVGEGLWFSEVWQYPAEGGGRLVAVNAQDGSLFVWSLEGVFAFSGEPPSDNGSVGGLGSPRRLAVDVGASQRPTCVTSLGIFFRSRRGIELLTRSQTVEYIGEPIQETLAAFPIVQSMTFDPESSCVLIEVSQGSSGGVATGSGRTLVFDTRAKVWQSVDRRTSLAALADAPAQDGAVIWDGAAWRYSWLGTDGVLNVEDHTTRLDPGAAWVTARARTSWIKTGGLQGKQFFNRLVLMARKSTSHRLSLAVGYDYATSLSTPTVFADSALDQLLAGGWPLTQVAHDAHDMAEGMAVSVEISDAPPTVGSVSTGDGSTWIGLTFDAVPRAGIYEVPEAAR